MAFLRPFTGEPPASVDFGLMMPADPSPGAQACSLPWHAHFPDWSSSVPWLSMIAIFVGAGIGALCRWGLGMALNPVFPTLPMGTLAANLAGGFLMGITLGLFEQFQAIPPAMRLLLATGFLGGLTTFSTFSAESVTLLLRQQYGWAAVLIGVHTLGSILATFAGYGLFRMLAKP
jgi:CrcB protein